MKRQEQVPWVSLQPSPTPQNLAGQLDSQRRTPKRSLVPKPTMPVVMHHRDPLNSIRFNSRPILPSRPQSHPMPDDIQPLDALILLDKPRMKLNGPLHNPHRYVRIRKRIPRVLLVSAAQDRTPARSTGHDVEDLVVPVVGARGGHHRARVVADDDGLSAGGVEFGVEHAG